MESSGFYRGKGFRFLCFVFGCIGLGYMGYQDIDSKENPDRNKINNIENVLGNVFIETMDSSLHDSIYFSVDKYENY